MIIVVMGNDGITDARCGNRRGGWGWQVIALIWVMGIDGVKRRDVDNWW